MNAVWCFLSITSTSPDVWRVFRQCSFIEEISDREQPPQSSSSLTHSFWQVWLTPAVSRIEKDSVEILVASRSIVWRPQAQEKHFQLFTCLLAVFSRTRFLHIWKAHIACTSLSSTISHFYCQHYWSYLSQPFDIDHMFCRLLNIYFYSVMDIIRSAICWTFFLLTSRYVSCALGCPYEGQVKPSQVTKVLQKLCLILIDLFYVKPANNKLKS